MKNLLVFVGLIIIVVGLYLWWDNRNTASSTPQIKPVTIPGSQEEKNKIIQEKVYQAKASLRTVATGLESFMIDNKKFPDRLEQLTTPISYLSQIPTDPFTENSKVQYIKKSDSDYLVWSIGPDGKDEHGNSQYNSGKGLTSSGDIIRTRTGIAQ